MKNIRIGFGVALFFLSFAVFAEDGVGVAGEKRSNFVPIGIGGGINPTMYGEDRTWVWLDMQFRYNNFLGRPGQRLDFDMGVFESRRFGTTWHIPVGHSDYFFDVGGLVGRTPSIVFERELSPFFNTFSRFGRNISDKHQVSYEISPRFRKYNRMEKQIRGNWRAIEVEDEFWEVYQRLRYGFLLSDNLYPPMLSTFAQISLNTNTMLAFEDNVFWGVAGELSQNVPVSYRARQSFLLRARFDVTPIGERHKYGGLLTGGMDFVRGWDYDFIGSKDEVNFSNRVIGTAEYQFYIATLPEMRFGFASFVSPSLKGFRPILTGALFLDAGYLFENLTEPKNSINANAASTGIAIRLLQPHMRTGAAIDIAWQITGTQKYLNDNRAAPALHLGFVQHF